MSSILKALRKLEEDRARSEGRIPLVAQDILKASPKRRLPRWLASACLGLVLVASSVAGYFLRGNLSFDPPKASVVSFSEILPPSEKLPHLAVSAATASEQEPQVSSAPAAATARAESAGPSSPASRAVAAKKVPARSATRPSTSGKATSAPAKQAPPRTAGRKAALRPSLALTGIAFVKARAERMAIINGLPVMEGTVIAGARVQEIRADRVRLEYSGESFEVRLDVPGGR